MQVKKLVLALATVAAAAAAPAAFAVDLTTGVSVDNQIFITGATAQTPGIARSMARLCTSGAGTLITLTDGATPAVQKGWKCNAAAAATYADLPGVTGPWIVLKNEGGSLNGINPLRNGVFNVAANAQLNTTNCTLVTATSYTCVPRVAAAGTPTHIGFSDVSEKIFKAKGSLAAVVAGNPYISDIPTGAGQGFGVVVSPALHALMVTDQGTANPSISRAQYASLMTQTGGLWDVLLPNATPHASQPLTIARRSTTSGTQASAELYFLGNPCLAGTAPVGGSLNSVAGSGGAGTSFGALPNQFIFKQEASSDAVLVDAASATAYVIGVVSLENPQPASSWKFVAINGVSPGGAGAPDWQRANTIAGKYDFAYESFMFQNTKASIGSATLLGNINDFKLALQADLGTGANLATDNGIYADPNATTADFGAETARYSRGGNECQTPQFVF